MHFCCALIVSLSFRSLLKLGSSHTDFTLFQILVSLFSSLHLIPSHLDSSTPQITAENLPSSTVSLLLFYWDFLIHTFSPLMAPTAEHYQKEQTICAHITSYYPHSLLTLREQMEL